LGLYLDLPVAEGEVLLVAMGAAPGQDAFERRETGKNLIAKEEELAGEADDLLGREQIVTPPPEHIMPVAQTLKHEPQTGTVRAGRLVPGRLHEVIAERPEDIELASILERQDEPHI
jgi:hypothetical protein